MANGAPTVSNGLVVTGVTTSTTFSGSGASLTNLPAAQLSGTAAAINGSNITNLNASNIASGTVPTARLGSGTANSSTFLAGDSTFKTVTGTTINNNADNRVITGSGTANTLNGESGLTFSSDRLILTNTSTPQIRINNDTSDGSSTRFVFGKATANNNFFNGAVAGNSCIGFPGDLLFGVGTSIKVRIDSNGDLGLGIAAVPQDSGARTLHIHDTTTGSAARAAIRLTHGSSGSTASNGAFIGFDNNPDFYIYNQESGNLRFGTAGSERMRIDSNGIVTMPNQPAFRAYISGGPQGINGTIPFSQIDYNIGSNYNNSNYRFTAPVAGRYSFHFYSIYRGNHTNNAFGFYINGGGFSGDRAHFTHSSLGNAWDYIDMSQVLNLGSGDYVTCLTHSAVDLHGGNWAAFSGHLVG